MATRKSNGTKKQQAHRERMLALGIKPRVKGQSYNRDQTKNRTWKGRGYRRPDTNTI